jgi:hypothetical protein
MTTNKKIEIYVPKLDDIGLCMCGKKRCGDYAPIDNSRNYMKIRNNQHSFVIEFKCKQGHKNRLYI